MPAPDRLKMLKGIIYAPLGVPVLPIELEFNVDLDVAPALAKYYKYLPILHAESYIVNRTRELRVRHADIIYNYVHRQIPQPVDPVYPAPPVPPPQPDDPPVDEFFYIGVADHKIRHQIGQNAFNQNLLGLNVGVPIANPMENLQMATMIDISTGDTYMEEDFVREETRFTFGGMGNFAATYALGCWDYNKVPLRHLEYFAAIVGEQYYERIYAVRQTGS